MPTTGHAPLLPQHSEKNAAVQFPSAADMRRLHRRRSKRLTLIAILLITFALYKFWYVPWRATILTRAQVQAILEKEAAEAHALAEAEARLVDSVTHPPAGNMAAHRAPNFDDINLVKDLDPSLAPSAPPNPHPSGRLIIIGDVHGQKSELEALLEKLEFKNATDHLVFAGDLVNKGPDSVGVVQLAMDLGASAVRGNHEDRLLLSWTGMRVPQAHLDPHSPDQDLDPAARDLKLSNMASFSRSAEFKYRVLSTKFSDQQLRWLGSLPVILRIGKIGSMGEVLVVHGGLVPGLDLQRQDPYHVMNMLTVDLLTHVPSNQREGTPWIKLWNRYQEKQPIDERSTVIYGHNSRDGLVIEEYTKGLDSGCVGGGQLTAFVIGESEDEIKQTIVQVDCEYGRS